MSAPEPRHEKETAPPARAVNPPEVVLVTTGSKEVGNVSEQYQTREDLEKALDESKKSEAQLRKIIDTIPTMAWCKLPDGSNEFSNQRWQDYTGNPVRGGARLGMASCSSSRRLAEVDGDLAKTA